MHNLLRKRIFVSIFIALLFAFGVQSACSANDNDSQSESQNEMMDMLRHAISVDTSAGQGNVPELDQYLADKLISAGFDASNIEIVPYKDTATMIVRYEGSGTGNPIIFDMHVDTVPASSEGWESDPFKLTERDGYLFARGVADMKTNTIATVYTFMRLKREGYKPERDLILILVGDEETGGSLATVADKYKNADFVINGDGVGSEALMDDSGNPILLKVQTAEKTYADFIIEANGEGGHSSEPTHDTSIYALAHALVAIQNYQFPTKYNETTKQYMKTISKVRKGLVADAMGILADDPDNKQAISVISNDPAVTGQIHTTCIATKIHAGGAPNALPQKTTANVNCRIFPDVELQEVEDRLAEAIGNSDIKINAPDTSGVPSSPVRPEIMKAIQSVVHKRYPEVMITPSMSSYGTDNAVYRRLGIDSYDVSPIFALENDTNAHGKNERIRASQIPWVMNFWYQLIPKLDSSIK